ncbi:3'-5' exonuclease [Hymenobacter sp. HSC-4F20]|uniref:3'-5' exonuclease n=1 Tax=Hymenobacter sp. HSC-4F20 TaxID=2864135 RepID=UPI001C732AA3|nr:3'-5' exonuclease [Hymenobacter sp. HSC-4F20]MBX0290981.1 3'-5' exonuclease [Hymenobacter sp. HSC-4F20]
MASYFKLRSTMCQERTEAKPACSWKMEYYCQDATGVCSICEYESGIIYLSPVLSQEQKDKGRTFNVPVDALPCAASEYDAAHERLQVALQKKEEQLARAKELAALLKTGKLYSAPEPEPVQAHFLDDFTVLDFETSDSYAIELAAVRVQNWQIVEQMQSFIQFRGTLNSYTKSLTGITSADLWNAPSEKAVLQQFKKLAGDSLLVAHNAPFDLRHLEAARTRQGATQPLANPFLCSVVVAKSRYPAPHKLGELCARFGIAVVGAHRALNDVLMTYQLLQRMHQEQPIPATLVGATSAAKAKKSAAQPSLFAAA